MTGEGAIKIEVSTIAEAVGERATHLYMLYNTIRQTRLFENELRRLEKGNKKALHTCRTVRPRIECVDEFRVVVSRKLSHNVGTGYTRRPCHENTSMSLMDSAFFLGVDNGFMACRVSTGVEFSLSEDPRVSHREVGKQLNLNDLQLGPQEEGKR